MRSKTGKQCSCRSINQRCHGSLANWEAEELEKCSPAQASNATELSEICARINRINSAFASGELEPLECIRQGNPYSG